jgi:hypothetical protein
MFEYFYRVALISDLKSKHPLTHPSFTVCTPTLQSFSRWGVDLSQVFHLLENFPYFNLKNSKLNLHQKVLVTGQ